MKVAIVDDEPLARQRLRRLLEALGGVEVVAEAEDAESTLRAVEETRPDALFLDVRMPGMDGLELAARFVELPPVVFVTAYDAFAVRAFEVNAVDYLLKPVSADRLALAVARLAGRAKAGVPAFDALPRDRARSAPRVVATDRSATRIFDALAIAHYWASDKYTAFSVDGAEHYTSESLVELEERLAPHGYLRVHRAHLVSAADVRALHAVDGGQDAELSDGTRVPVSRRMITALRSALGLRSAP